MLISFLFLSINKNKNYHKNKELPTSILCQEMFQSWGTEDPRVFL